MPSGVDGMPDVARSPWAASTQTAACCRDLRDNPPTATRRQARAADHPFTGGTMFESRARTLLAMAVLATVPLVPPAFGQAAYPNKPIKLIAPVQPGGGVDLVARTVGERLSRALGQPVVVENVSGGGGIVGSQTTARAAPDGYTLMIGYVGTHGTNPAVRKLPYDAIRDFTPVAMVGGTPNILVVPPSVPATTLVEFIAYAKANKGKLSYGSSGPGTLTHLAMEQLKVAADLDIVHIPYRGIGPAITDILGAQTQALFPGLAAALPHIKAGKMRPLAITGTKRHPLVPDVPTFEELGYKGFDGVQWYGIVGPANLPAPVVKTLNAEINKLLANPELRERLSGEALEPMPMAPEQFGQYMRDDIAKWAKVAKEQNIQVND
jgi:tripartite-type tricarboxylate transporter receptor subunit TctC